MSDARGPEGLVKITYGIVASSLLKKRGKFKLGNFFELCSALWTYLKDINQLHHIRMTLALFEKTDF